METKFPLWHNTIVKIFAWCLWWFIHQNLWFSMHLQHFTYIFSFLLCLIICKTDISFGTLRSEVWGDKIVIGPTKEYYSLVPPNSLRKEQTRFGLPTICWHLCLILNNLKFLLVFYSLRFSMVSESTYFTSHVFILVKQWDRFILIGPNYKNDESRVLCLVTFPYEGLLMKCAGSADMC